MIVYIIFALVFYIAAVVTIHPFFRERFKKLLLFPTSNHQNHLACLDTLRGLAALLVAIFHTWQWTQLAFNSARDLMPFISRGDAAVPIFVTLSGLLIYRSLKKVDSLDGIREYINRRFLRIFPVYLVTVIVSSIAIGPFNANITPMQYEISEIFMLRSLGSPNFSNPQAWSLYVEVLFYALIPLFVIMTRERSLLWASIALAVFALGDAIGPRELGLWKYFCIGIIAAEIISRWKIRPHTASILGVLGIFIVYLDLRTGHDWIGRSINKLFGGYIQITGGHPAYTLSLALGMLLLIVGTVQSPLFRRIFEIYPLRVLGTISYSLFMWHSFLIVANFPVTFGGVGNPILTGLTPSLSAWQMPFIVIPALISSATISYLLIERPFLLKRLDMPKQTIIQVQATPKFSTNIP